MARSLLNLLSTLQIVLIFVGGGVLLAVGLALGIRKAIPDIAERSYEEFADGLRVVYELLFALILAFVIASVLDKFSDAESAVASEATALSQMVRSNVAFPVEKEVELNRGISAYVNAVINDEWRTMRDGKASAEAAGTLETLYALYADFTPADGVQSTLHEQAIVQLDDVANARLDRLSIASAKLPTILVLMLPLGVILLLVLEYRPRLGNRSQVAFMGLLALIVTSSYLLTVVFDYPFSGDVSVSSEPLTSDTLAALVGSEPRAAQPGDQPLPLTADDLEGVWSSDAYGTVLLRRVGDEIRGVYRLADGAIRGSLSSDGVFTGRWCEGPTRKPGTSSKTSDAGLVEWRLINTKSDGRIITGAWSYGYDRQPDGSLKPDGGWDLRKLERDDALDLDRQLTNDPESRFCHEA